MYKYEKKSNPIVQFAGKFYLTARTDKCTNGD